MTLLSIDIGLSGALCWFEDGELIEVFNTPTLKVKRSGTNRMKNIIDYESLAEIFRQVNPNVCVLEFVHSMPSQGVSSSFLFGESFGAVKALSYSQTDNIVMVTPQKWKKHFSLIGTSKNQATLLAKSMNKKITNSGKADAYLIGLYYLQTSKDK